MKQLRDDQYREILAASDLRPFVSWQVRAAFYRLRHDFDLLLQEHDQQRLELARLLSELDLNPGRSGDCKKEPETQLSTDHQPLGPAG